MCYNPVSSKERRTSWCNMVWYFNAFSNIKRLYRRYYIWSTRSILNNHLDQIRGYGMNLLCNISDTVTAAKIIDWFCCKELILFYAGMTVLYLPCIRKSTCISIREKKYSKYIPLDKARTERWTKAQLTTILVCVNRCFCSSTTDRLRHPLCFLWSGTNGCWNSHHHTKYLHTKWSS